MDWTAFTKILRNDLYSSCGSALSFKERWFRLSLREMPFLSSSGCRNRIFFLRISLRKQSWKFGSWGRAKSRNSVTMLFSLFDSSIMSPVNFAFDLWESGMEPNSSAVLLIIPKGFLISWETPATISPKAAKRSAWFNWFSSSLCSLALSSMILSALWTIKRRAMNIIPIMRIESPNMRY